MKTEEEIVDRFNTLRDRFCMIFHGYVNQMRSCNLKTPLYRYRLYPECKIRESEFYFAIVYVDDTEYEPRPKTAFMCSYHLSSGAWEMDVDMGFSRAMVELMRWVTCSVDWKGFIDGEPTHIPSFKTMLEETYTRLPSNYSVIRGPGPWRVMIGKQPKESYRFATLSFKK